MMRCSTTTLLLWGVQLQYIFGNLLLLRRDGESLLNYLKRVDILYCNYDDFCDIPGATTTVRLPPVPGEWPPSDPWDRGFSSYSLSTCTVVCEEPCKCDEQCGKFHDCCPNAPQYRTNSQMPSAWTCRSATMKVQSEDRTFYYMISACQDDFNDETIIWKCENSNQSEDLILKTPVTSNSNVTYINKYCAVCNWEVNYKSWTLAPKCNSSIHIPSSTEQAEILEVIVNHPHCNIELQVPSEEIRPSLRNCGADDRYVISKCNVTGKWKQYDKQIEDGCLNYNHPLDAKYRNPFCFVCNTDNFEYECDRSPNALPTTKPFSALLDFTEDEYTRPPTCSRGYRYDFTKTNCREIFCAGGMWLKDDKTCVTILNPGHDTIFKTWIVYSVDRSLVECPTEHSFSEEIAVPLKSNFLPNNFNETFTISGGHILGICHPSFSADKARLNLHDIVFAMEIEYIGRGNLSITEVNDLIFNWTFRSHNIHFQSTILELNPYSPRTLNITHLYDEDLIGMDPRSTLIAFFPGFWFDRERPRMTVNKQQTCPYVILSSEEFEFSANDSFIHLRDVDYNLPLGDYLYINDSSVAICSEPYFTRVEKLRINQPEKEDEVLVITSIVCTSVSMVCLLATFVVYCLLKSLRSLPGKNNMALVVTLFFAQLVFQFRAQPSHGNIACNAWGIMTHYLWLAAMLWMNICSFHMCRVFGHLHIVGNTDKIGADNRNFLSYIFYSHSIPILFIIIVIAVSSSESDNVGYISSFCFISSKQLLAFTFALPIGLVVLGNFGMFVFVVVSIYRSASSTKMAKNDRNYLHVYFRLSTLTGSMWIFGFIDQWSGIIVFSYIFSILNCLQGVFIFIAFVCNGRIFKSLKKRFASTQSHTPGSAYVMSTSKTTESTSQSTSQSTRSKD